MKPTTKIFLYFLFALGAFVTFLYIQFPSEMVKASIEQRVQAVQPEAYLEIDEVSPTVPPGLMIEPLSISYSDMPIVRMDFFKIRPSLLYLFSKSKRYTYRAEIGSGDLKGRATTGLGNNSEQSKITMTLNRVPLKYIDILNQSKVYQTEGDLDATINFDSAKGGGTADVSLDISPARIVFDPPLMDIASLDFSNLNSQLVITERMLQIKNCEATGTQIDAKLTGSVIFRQPIEQSRISLSLTLKPQAAFIADNKDNIMGGLFASPNSQKRGIVFRISGTIDNPRYVIR